MPSKSGKGSEFERWFCRRLTAWWRGKLTLDAKEDVAFWRTAGSGGRATQRAKKGQKSKTAGDLTATDSEGEPFSKLVTPELKRGYNHANIHDLLDTASIVNLPYTQWIEQARRSAAAAETPYWMLVHQRNRKQPLVVVPIDLLADGGASVPSFNHAVLRTIVRDYENPMTGVVVRVLVCNLEDFLRFFGPGFIRTLYRGR